MSSPALEVLIERQAALIAALDKGEVSAIELATQEMGHALQAVSNQNAWNHRSDVEQISYALKQTHAARIRINYLSEWTRQKIDQLADLRGLKTAANRGKY